MADLKISQLPGVATPTAADLFVTVTGGTTSQVTRQQLHTVLNGDDFNLETGGEIVGLGGIVRMSATSISNAMVQLNAEDPAYTATYFPLALKSTGAYIDFLSASDTMARISKSGNGLSLVGGGFNVRPDVASVIPFYVQGVAAQTADLFQVRDSAATEFLTVEAGGNTVIGAGSHLVVKNDLGTADLTISHDTNAQISAPNSTYLILNAANYVQIQAALNLTTKPILQAGVQVLGANRELTNITQLVLEDTIAGTDTATFDHDGTDFNTTFVNTTDWNIDGASGIYFTGSTTPKIYMEDAFDGAFARMSMGSPITGSWYLHVDGAATAPTSTNFSIKAAESSTVINTTGGGASGFAADGVANFRFYPGGAPARVEVRSGYEFHIYDALNTDYASFSHDGTDFNTAFTNTTDWNISGIGSFLNVDAPIRTQTDITTLTPPTTEAVTGGFNIVDADRTDELCRFGFAGSNRFEILNRMHGGPVWIMSEDNAGLERPLLTGDPDSGTALYYAGNAMLTTISGGVEINRNANAQTTLRIGENATLQGSAADARIEMYAEEVGAIYGAALAVGGANLQFLGVGTNPITSTQWSMSIDILSGNNLQIRNSTNTDYALFSHDGTDFNTAFTNTTDWNVTGLTGAMVVQSDIELIADGSKYGWVTGGGAARASISSSASHDLSFKISTGIEAMHISETGDVDVVDGFLAAFQPVNPWNPFCEQGKVYDVIRTNRFHGRHDQLFVSVDAVENTTTKNLLFDGSYDSLIQMGVAAGADVVVLIDFEPYGLTGTNGFTYAGGRFHLYSYQAKAPDAVTARVKDRNDVWYACTVRVVADDAVGANVYEIDTPPAAYNYITAVEFTLTPQATTNIWLSQIEYHPERMNMTEGGDITRYSLTQQEKVRGNWQFTGPDAIEVLTDIATASPPTSEAVTGRIRWYDASETENLGEFGFLGNNQFGFSNNMHGGGVIFKGQNDSGTLMSLLYMDPGNASVFYDPVVSGLQAFRIETGGKIAIRSNDDVTNTRWIDFQNQSGVSQGWMGHFASDTFAIVNRVHGGAISLAAEDLGGVQRNLFFADPDGSTILYNAGSLTMSTNASGVAMSAGKNFSITGTGGVGNVQFAHDGTDFNTVFTNTTDWNITGLTGGVIIDDGQLTIHDGTAAPLLGDARLEIGDYGGVLGGPNKLLSLNSLGGTAGGQTGPFYGVWADIFPNNDATDVYGGYFEVAHATVQDVYGVWAQASQGNSTDDNIGVLGWADTESGSTNHRANRALGTGPVAGVYAKATTFNATNTAQTTALYATNESVFAAESYGVWINTVAGPTNIYPLKIDHAGNAILEMIVGSLDFKLRDGWRFQIWDTTDTVKGEFLHTGSYFALAMDNTSFRVTTTADAAGSLNVNNADGRVGIRSTSFNGDLNIGGAKFVQFDGDTGGIISGISTLRTNSTNTGNLTFGAANHRFGGDVGGGRVNIVGTANTLPALAIQEGQADQTLISFEDTVGAQGLSFRWDQLVYTSGNGIPRIGVFHFQNPAGADGDGMGIALQVENASGSPRDVGYIDAVFDDISADIATLKFRVRPGSADANPTEVMRLEGTAALAAGETSLWLYDNDNGTLEQVTVGAADSGGSGFKVLRIPN